MTGASLHNIIQSQFFTPPASCNPYQGNCTVGVGDGLVAITGGTSVLSITNGAYVQTSDPVAGTLTLASPHKMVGNFLNNGLMLIDLPASDAYSVITTTGSNTFTVIGGPSPTLKAGDMLWSDAFLFGSSVSSAHNNLVGTPTVATRRLPWLCRDVRHHDVAWTHLPQYL